VGTWVEGVRWWAPPRTVRAIKAAEAASLVLVMVTKATDMTNKHEAASSWTAPEFYCCFPVLACCDGAWVPL
jgi:hypothetical protein